MVQAPELSHACGPEAAALPRSSQGKKVGSRRHKVREGQLRCVVCATDPTMALAGRSWGLLQLGRHRIPGASPTRLPLLSGTAADGRRLTHDAHAHPSKGASWARLRAARRGSLPPLHPAWKPRVSDMTSSATSATTHVHMDDAFCSRRGGGTVGRGFWWVIMVPCARHCQRARLRVQVVEGRRGYCLPGVAQPLARCLATSPAQTVTGTPDDSVHAGERQLDLLCRSPHRWRQSWRRRWC